MEKHVSRGLPAISGLARLAPLAAIMLLAGCMSWPDDRFRPTVPDEAKLPFVDQTWSTRKGKALTLNDYKDSLRALLKSVWVAGEGKNDQLWDYGMTTLVGGTAATLGALHGATGLTNTGLAVAAGGQTVKTYYNPQEVKDIHLAAHLKLSCISTELGNLSETKRLKAMDTKAEGSAEAGNALTDIGRSVDAVLNGYRRSLMGKAPQVSSRDDLLRFADEYRTKTKEAETKAKESGAADDAADADDPPPAKAPAVAGTPASAATPAAPATTATSATSATSATPGLPTTLIVQMVPTATVAAEKAEATKKRYAAQFIDLKVRLEACTKTALNP